MNAVQGVKFPIHKNALASTQGANRPKVAQQLRMLERNEQPSNMPANSILQSAQSYAQKLCEQRKKAQDTALKVTKLKYKYKDISSRIISSKTSHTAKQVAGAARRELLRLKKEKLKNQDDPDLDAEIAHAKAMERVAKKKAKHLEEEELIKVKDGASSHIEEIEKEASKESENAKQVSSQDEGLQVDGQEVIFQEELSEEMSEQMQELSTKMSEQIQEISEEMSEQMRELSEEIFEEMEEAVAEFSQQMEELSLEVIPGQEMEPEEFKELKTKHRNKEMKEIVQADAEYLKAVFDNLEKSKSTEAIPGLSAPVTNTPMPSAADAMSVSAPCVQPIIDISI